MSDAIAIRPGHESALSAMFDSEFASIVRVFARYPEIGGTYFRLVDAGFQPVDLHPESPKPLIGIGDVFSATATASALDAELPLRIDQLREKRAALHGSDEKRLEAMVVRNALGNHLRLDDLGPAFRFVASQWRIESGAKRKFLDILAIDVSTAELVVVELKPTRDQSAVTQASLYASILREHDATTGPFFARLGQAMARIYGCNDLPKTLTPGRVRAIAVWPIRDGSKQLRVIECPVLEHRMG